MGEIAEIRVARVEDLDALADLFDRHGGYMEGRRDACAGTMANPKSLMLVAHLDGELVAGAHASMMTANAVRAELPDCDALQACGLDGELPERIGYLSLGATEPAARGQGIATRMLRIFNHWLAGQGIDLVVAVAWAAPDGSAPSAGLLDRAGFTSSPLIENFWAQLDESTVACPKCYDKRCQCSGIVYQLRLSD